MAISQRTMTLEEFLRLPEEEPALEYVDGAVTQKMSPKAIHGWLQGQLVTWFNEFGVPRKLAAAFSETRSTYARTSTVPDVSVFRWDRIPRDGRGWPEDDLFLAPDIAVEIASPGQSRRSLFERCRWYVDHDVEISLLVESRMRSITRFRRGEEPRTYRGDERIDLDSVLPGFEFTPNLLFDRLNLT